MDKIQRHRCYTETDGGGYGFGSMGPSEQGDYVLYDDHVRILGEVTELREIALKNAEAYLARAHGAEAERDAAKGLLREARACIPSNDNPDSSDYIDQLRGRIDEMLGRG